MKRSTTSGVTATTTLPVGVPVVVDDEGETLSLTFFTRPPNCAVASCGTRSAASVRARRVIPWRRGRRTVFLTCESLPERPTLSGTWRPHRPISYPELHTCVVVPHSP